MVARVGKARLFQRMPPCALSSLRSAPPSFLLLLLCLERRKNCLKKLKNNSTNQTNINTNNFLPLLLSWSSFCIQMVRCKQNKKTGKRRNSEKGKKRKREEVESFFRKRKRKKKTRSLPFPPPRLLALKPPLVI